MRLGLRLYVRYETDTQPDRCAALPACTDNTFSIFTYLLTLFLSVCPSVTHRELTSSDRGCVLSYGNVVSSRRT